ncbi:MAG: integrase core domain-containing protein [Candidatus Magasanikbacteria bacterium]
MASLDTNTYKWLFTKNWGTDFVRGTKLLDKHERWRRVAKILKLSKTARMRLEWIIYNYQGNSVQQTSRHFGISRKTFYKWFNLFDEDNIYSLRKLEDKSKAPQHVRQPEITPAQEERVILLRKKYMQYGKIKLAKLYKGKYGEQISSWKIQRVITKHKLYLNPTKTAKISKKRRGTGKKKRITELNLNKLPWYKKKAGYIICLDTIVIYSCGLKRYIFTAIDKYGKVAFARMYKTKSTTNSKDFLYRLHYLLDGKIPKVGHDNGSEFEKYFKEACKKLLIEQYYSRVRTPKDNPDNERFNQTLQTEFLNLGNFHPDPEIFNQKLTEWLIEYNFHRPHQTLGYETPLNFSKVLPMYSSCTCY